MLMNRRRMMYKIYEEAKEFAQEFIAPYAKKCDEEAIFPVESFQKMGEKGYFNLLIPEQYGGLGKGLEEHSQVCMAFAEASATASLCYMMHNVGLHCVMTYGSDTLKEKIAKDLRWHTVSLKQVHILSSLSLKSIIQKMVLYLTVQKVW